MKNTIEVTRKEAREILRIARGVEMVELLTNKQNGKWMGGRGGRVETIKQDLDILIEQRQDEKVGLLFDDVFIITCINEIHAVRGGGQKAYTYSKDKLHLATKHYNRLLREDYLYTNIKTNF